MTLLEEIIFGLEVRRCTILYSGNKENCLGLVAADSIWPLSNWSERLVCAAVRRSEAECMVF